MSPAINLVEGFNEMFGTIVVCLTSHTWRQKEIVHEYNSIKAYVMVMIIVITVHEHIYW
jgi:hypothetical protein